MSKKQINLLDLWNKNRNPQSSTSTDVSSSSANLPHPQNCFSSTSSSAAAVSPPSSFTSESELISSGILQEEVVDIEVVSNYSSSLHPSQDALNDHDYHSDGTATSTSTSMDKVICNKPKSKTKSTSETKTKSKSKPLRDRNYLARWEKVPEAMYKTYICDEFGVKHEKYVLWLYQKDNRMYCSLCQFHHSKGHSNGRKNSWVTPGYTSFSLDKVKNHKISSAHKEAEKQESDQKSGAQDDWNKTQAKEISKHKLAVQNLMFCCIYICQQYLPLNTLEPLCVLLEQLGVQLLPSTISAVNYRNDDAALNFLQHVAGYLHEELTEKIKSSPVVGWMMDESTSRTVEKSCIVYVRYLDNYKPMTSFYALLNMEGDGTAANIVNNIVAKWGKDGLNPVNSCWFASDNASTFTGIHEGVVAKLRRHFGIDYLESNPCVAHSFCLVGNHASYKIDPVTNKPVMYECISNLETGIGKIYTYFSRSCGRQRTLKEWQDFLDMPQLKFKRIYEIRWSSIKDCLKPIVQNIQPNNQALLATLEQNRCDKDNTIADRESAKELLQLVLNDEFLFYLHFHHDLHQCVLGPITKLMQCDKVSYYYLMQEIKEKKNLMSRWVSQMPFTWGPTLAHYIKQTAKGTFGAFTITLCKRENVAQQCADHIERLIKELDKRFAPSSLQESMAVLFDPRYLMEHKEDIDSPEYGRSALDFLVDKYKKFNGFDSKAAQTEWESLKPSLRDFTDTFSKSKTDDQFWEQFLLIKSSISDRFLDENKNVLLLLSIYLISPTNSAECERGFSTANRIQTKARARIKIETLDPLMNVCLLFPKNLKSQRSQQVIDRSFDSWSDPAEHRRYRQMKLMIDVPDDYEPVKKTRPNAKKRKRTTMSPESTKKKPKKPKAKAIKCANGCKQEISSDDPNQRDAIQCCHQNDDFEWVDQEENCCRWLCNGCRIKFGISTEGFWFCSDHIDMHSEDESDENEEMDE